MLFRIQEEVARLIERYDFLAIPVVEENNVLVGIVTVDDIIDVVIREADEDYEKFAASGKDITFDTKAYVAAYLLPAMADFTLVYRTDFRKHYQLF